MEAKENNSGTIKVQLNSLEALNRFIGDNPDMQIRVKEAIIQQFAKQYLKESNDNIKDEVLKAVKREIENTNYFGLFERNQNFHNSFKLSDKLKELIYNEVMEYMRDEIKVMIQDAFGPLLNIAKERAASTVDSIEQKLSEKYIDSLVKHRITKMLEKLD